LYDNEVDVGVYMVFGFENLIKVII